MSGEDSAFAALGLRPGAGRAEVNDAYRRLIKIHHPDRNGGDGRRAAEINRAYTILARDRDLGRRRPRSVPVPVRPPRRKPNSRGRTWLFLFAAAGLTAAALGSVEGDDVRRAITVPVASDFPDVEMQPSPVQAADFDEPLEAPVMNRAIAEAAGIYGAGDWEAAAEYSRDCRAKIRGRPSLPLFDACTAFDEAILILDSDSSGESAGFSGSAVAIRQGALARAFGGDTSDADSRLQRFRSYVELALLPVLDPAAGQSTI